MWKGGVVVSFLPGEVLLDYARTISSFGQSGEKTWSPSLDEYDEGLFLFQRNYPDRELYFSHSDQRFDFDEDNGNDEDCELRAGGRPGSE